MIDQAITKADLEIGKIVKAFNEASANAATMEELEQAFSTAATNAT